MDLQETRPPARKTVENYLQFSIKIYGETVLSSVYISRDHALHFVRRGLKIPRFTERPP